MLSSQTLRSLHPQIDPCRPRRRRILGPLQRRKSRPGAGRRGRDEEIRLRLLL